MEMCFITFRSVTYAQRGERVLAEEGIRARLQRTPRWMEEQGCGYCLTLSPRQVHRAAALLRRNNVPMRRVYCRGQSGELEEMAL